MATVEAARANLVPYGPGAIGNPAGERVSRATKEFAEYVRGGKHARSRQLADELQAIALDRTEKATMARVRAAEILLDRAYGKSPDGLALALSEEAMSASVELGVRFVMGSRRVEFTEEAALPLIEQPPADTNGPVGPPASS